MAPQTKPDYLQSPLSAESTEIRERLEKSLSECYAALPSLKGVARIKAQRDIDRREQQLAWQGANPKEITFEDLHDHIHLPHHDDAVENKYQAKIRNRATAIRGYCVMCQGGSVIGVKECPSGTCPLFPFRMGKDPLRGYELPKAAPVIIEMDDDVPDTLFEEGDDGEEADANE